MNKGQEKPINKILKIKNPQMILLLIIHKFHSFILSNYFEYLSCNKHAYCLAINQTELMVASMTLLNNRTYLECELTFIDLKC